MSARCQITGRTVGFGKAVSHSHRRTRRRWPPNIQLKAYYLPSEDRRIKVRVSAQGIKVIDRDGHRGRRRAARAGSAPAHFAMARNEIRPIVKPCSTAGTGYTYVNLCHSQEPA